MRVLFLSIIGCVVLGKLCLCQPNESLRIFNNEKFIFTLLRTSFRLLDSNKIELSKTLVTSNISATDREAIKQLKYEDWMMLLANETTDWAANLFLYDLYKEDADIFKLANTREKWLRCCKETDIAFWEKKLLKK